MSSSGSGTGSFGDLPEGWTRHELNGRTFYYNKITKKIQPDPPAGVELTSPTASAPPQWPAADAEQDGGSAPPLPVPPSAPVASTQAAFSYPHQLPVAERRPQFVHMHPQPHTVPLMQAQVLQDMPVMPPFPFPNPQSRLEVLANAVEVRPGCYRAPSPSAARAEEAAPRPAPPAPVVARALAVTPPASSPAAPPRTETLNVLVPEPGLQAGQQLSFTTPTAQQMSVTVQQAVAPGSILTVQYQVPAAQQPPQFEPQQQQQPQRHGLSVPLPRVDAAISEDHNAMIASWWLYGSGWCLACCCPPLCVVPWGIAAMWYFCKPPTVRAQYRQQRTPARVSLWTCLCLLLLAVVMAVIAVAAGGAEFHFRPHLPPHHHHQPSDGPRPAQLNFNAVDSYWLPQLQDLERNGEGVPTWMTTSIVIADSSISYPGFVLSTPTPSSEVAVEMLAHTNTEPVLV